MRENDLISREALLESMATVVFRNVPVEHQPYMQAACEVFVRLVNDAPAVDAEPVRHGRWVFDNGVDHCYKCSECKAVKPPHYISDDFCPNCGAMMN